MLINSRQNVFALLRVRHVVLITSASAGIAFQWNEKKFLRPLLYNDCYVWACARVCCVRVRVGVRMRVRICCKFDLWFDYKSIVGLCTHYMMFTSYQSIILVYLGINRPTWIRLHTRIAVTRWDPDYVLKYVMYVLHVKNILRDTWRLNKLYGNQ